MTNRYHNLEAFRRTVADLTADQDITGDLLLAAIWLARATILREPEPGEGRWSYRNMTRDLYGTTKRQQTLGYDRLLTALKADIPRYDWQTDNEALWHPFGGYQCAAPMVRRVGECGQPATKDHHLTDLGTGRVHVLAACRRHHAWLDLELVKNREQVDALGVHLPTPPANVGGALARHIHGISWIRWWRRLDPDWTPPADDAPTARPRLAVLTFEPVEASAPAGALTVLRGGWTA